MVITVSYADIQKSSAFIQNCINASVKRMPNEMCSHVTFFTCLPDTDECTIGLDDCDPNAVCTNIAGTWTCVCNTGYSGSGQMCTGNLTWYRFSKNVPFKNGVLTLLICLVTWSDVVRNNKERLLGDTSTASTPNDNGQMDW